MTKFQKIMNKIIITEPCVINFPNLHTSTTDAYGNKFYSVQARFPKGSKTVKEYNDFIELMKKTNNISPTVNYTKMKDGDEVVYTSGEKEGEPIDYYRDTFYVDLKNRNERPTCVISTNDLGGKSCEITNLDDIEKMFNKGSKCICTIKLCCFERKSVNLPCISVVLMGIRLLESADFSVSNIASIEEMGVSSEDVILENEAKLLISNKPIEKNTVIEAKLVEADVVDVPDAKIIPQSEIKDSNINNLFNV